MKKKEVTIPSCDSRPRVYTIGHSTRPLTEFIEILDQYTIKKIIDIRTIPKSRHNPQFNTDHLKKLLKSHYVHIKGLGGLRHPKKDSINQGWHNSSFRGFADYMQTKEFAGSLARLIKYAQKNPVVIMCAEAVPWRCHRSLIGDALLIHGIDVVDIFSQTACKPHTLTSFARVSITYP